MNGFLAVTAILGFCILLFGFIVLMRYISYRETLALAEKGLVRPEMAHDNGKGALRWGIVIASLGLALCIGLYPLGWLGGGGVYPLNLGPWMLAGFIPLFFGLGLVLIYVLTSEDKSGSTTDPAAPPPDQTQSKQQIAQDNPVTDNGEEMS